jgi:hypothetical protein
MRSSHVSGTQLHLSPPSRNTSERLGDPEERHGAHNIRPQNPQVGL